MTPSVHSLDEAVFWLLLAALWWLFYWPYRSYRLDDTRYRLFVIRDRLFDAAADGASIRFEDRAYGMTRTMINGMLRTLEDYGVLRLLYIAWRYSRDRRLQQMCAQYGEDYESAVQQLEPEGRDLVIDAVLRAQRVFLEHVLKTSLLMFLLYFVIRAIRPVRTWSERVWGLYTAHVRPVLDFESNIAGHDGRSARYLADANSTG